MSSAVWGCVIILASSSVSHSCPPEVYLTLHWKKAKCMKHEQLGHCHYYICILGTVMPGLNNKADGTDFTKGMMN